jgi:hypothetical protein
MTNLDKKINSLKPGQEIEISRCNGVSTTAVRSGDGKTLKFVRNTANGFEVFKTCRF